MKKDLQSELKNYLDSDESLLWSGKPKQGIKLTSNEAFIIPFCLFSGGFFVFWGQILITKETLLSSKLSGLPLILIGLYLIIGRFFFDAKRREKITYAITKNRVIIKSGIFQKSIKSINIKTLSDITLNEKPDKSGTIILGTENKGTIRAAGFSGPNERIAPTIEMIDNARTVYQKIIDLQKEK